MSIEIPYSWDTIIKVLDSDGNPVEGMVKLYDSYDGTIKEIQQNYFSSDNTEWKYTFDRGTFWSNGTDRTTPNLFAVMTDTANNVLFTTTILENASQTTYLEVIVGTTPEIENVYTWTPAINIPDGSGGIEDPVIYESTISVKNSNGNIFSCMIHLFSESEFHSYELKHAIYNSSNSSFIAQFTKEAFQHGNNTIDTLNLKVVLTDFNYNIFYESDIINDVSLKSKIDIVLDTIRTDVLELETNSEEITSGDTSYSLGTYNEEISLWDYVSYDVPETFTTLASQTVLDNCVDINGITSDDYNKICKCQYCSNEWFIANDFLAAGDCTTADGEFYVDGYLTNLAGKPVSGKHMSLFCLAKDYAKYKDDVVFDEDRFGNYDYRCLGCNNADSITDFSGYYKIKFDLDNFDKNLAENLKPLVWVGCRYDDDYVVDEDEIVSSDIVNLSTKRFKINLTADLKAAVTLSKKDEIEASLYKALGYTYLSKDDLEFTGTIKAISKKTGYSDEEVMNYAKACSLEKEIIKEDNSSTDDYLNITSTDVCYALASNEASDNLAKIRTLSSSKLTEILSDAITNKIVGHEINDKFDLIIDELLLLKEEQFGEMGELDDYEVCSSHKDSDLFIRYLAFYITTYSGTSFYKDGIYSDFLELYDSFDSNVEEFEEFLRKEYSDLKYSSDLESASGFDESQLQGILYMLDLYNVSNGFVMFSAQMLEWSKTNNVFNIMKFREKFDLLNESDYITEMESVSKRYPIVNGFVWISYDKWYGDKSYLKNGQPIAALPEEIPGTTLNDQYLIYRTQFSKQLEKYVVHDEFKANVFGYYNEDGSSNTIDNNDECTAWGKYLGYFLKDAILDFNLEESFVTDWDDLINTIVDDHYTAEEPSESVEDEVANKALFKKEILRSILAMQRAYRLTKNFDAGNYLVINNLNSSYKISSYKKNKFMADHFRGLGGIKESSDIHQMASQYASELMHKIGALTQGMNNQSDSLSAVPVVSYNNEFPLAVTEPPVVDSLIGKSDFSYSPNWETLFGQMTETETDQSESVFSLSSYFTDLLKFLTNDVENAKVHTQLLARRSDIEQIELTSENTDTMMPYIDLVNEILEEIIATSTFSINLSLTDTSLNSLEGLLADEFVTAINENANLADTFESKAMYIDSEDLVLYEGIDAEYVVVGGVELTVKNEYILTDNSIRCVLKLADNDENSTKIKIIVSPFYQTSWSSDKLEAMPEHFNKSAYDLLKSAKYPMNLPFDLSAKESEIYIDALGVTQEEVDVAFSETEVNKLAKAYFKLTESEKLIIEEALKEEINSSITTHELWGFSTDEEVSILHPEDNSEIVTGTYFEILRLFSVIINRSGVSGDKIKELLDCTCVNNECLLDCTCVNNKYLFDVVPMSEKGYQTSEQDDLKIVLLDPENENESGPFYEEDFNENFSKALRMMIAYIRLKNMLGNWSFTEIDVFIQAYGKENIFSNLYQFVKFQEVSKLSSLEIYALAFQNNVNTSSKVFWDALYFEKFIYTYPSDEIKELLYELIDSPLDLIYDSNEEDEDEENEDEENEDEEDEENEENDKKLFADFIDFLCKSLDVTQTDFLITIDLLNKSLENLAYNDLREIYSFIEACNYYKLEISEYESLNSMIGLSYSSIENMLEVKDKIIAWTGIDALAINSLLTQKNSTGDQIWNYARSTDEEFIVIAEKLNTSLQEYLLTFAPGIFELYNDAIKNTTTEGENTVITYELTDEAKKIIVELMPELKNTIVSSLAEILEVDEDVLTYFTESILDKTIEVDVDSVPELIKIKVLDYWSDNVMGTLIDKGEELKIQNESLIDPSVDTSGFKCEEDLISEISLDISNEYYVVERSILFAAELDLELELLKYSVNGMTDEISLLLENNNYVITSDFENQILDWNKFWDFEDTSIVETIEIDQFISFIEQSSYYNNSEISGTDLLKIWSINLIATSNIIINDDSNQVVIDEVLEKLSLANQTESLSGIFSITEENIKDAYSVLNLSGGDSFDIENLLGSYIESWIKIEDALFMIKATSMSPTDLSNQIMIDSYTAESAIALEKNLSKIYGSSTWYEKVKNIRSQLREEQRDALVSYILSQNTEVLNESTEDNLVFSNEYFSSSKDLYDYYLIDTDTNSDVQTSRLKRAVSSVQLFIQRVKLGLEDGCSFEPDEKDQLVWMKNYRVWEANRKVFLYPENWIDSDLRDDKSPFFKALEEEVANAPLTHETAKEAFENYFDKVKDVSNLKIVNGYEYGDIKYFIGRTKGIPKKYYYRTYVDKHNGSGVWNPWEKIDLEIDSDLVMPVIFNEKLHILWPNYTPKEINNSSQTDFSSTKSEVEGETETTESVTLEEQNIIKGVEIKMNMASYDGKKWKGPQMTEEVLFSTNDYFVPLLPAKADFGQIYNYIVKPIEGNYIEIEVYKTTNIFSHDDMGEYDESSDSTLFQAEQKEIAKASESYISRQSIVLEGSFQIASDGFTRIQYYPETIDYTYAMWNYFPDRARVVNNTGYSDSRMRLMEGSGRKYSLMYPIFTPMLNKTPADFSITPLNFSFRYNSESSFVYSDDNRTFFMQRSNDSAICYGISTINHPIMNSIASRYSVEGFDGIMCRQTQALPVCENYYYSYNTSNYYHNVYLGYYLAGDKRAEQVSRQLFDFRFDPNRSVVNRPFPKEVVDFEYGSSMAIYNWELFFYIPMYLGEKLSENNQFDDARTWYNYVFNPENDLNDYEETQSWVKDLPSGAKFWNFLPFFSNKNVNLNTQEELGLTNEDNNTFDDNNLSNLVSDWKLNPFNPHLIARSRIAAYQKFVVMKYLDNLMEWADSLFRTDTIESITEATQLYILADEILGNKPTTSESLIEKAPLSYNDLEKLDSGSFNSIMIDAEDNLIKPKLSQNNYATTLDDKAKDILKIGVNMIYFGTPQNSQLLGYWDKVSDRLYKIRNSMNINGTKRTLALFAPPIDPGMLVKAVASGVDLASAIANLNAPLPHYRFRRIHSKAIELCNEVKSLGGGLLSALEKKDGEYISVLRNEHERILLERNTDIRDMQLQEAENTIESLNVSLESASIRQSHYEILISIGLLPAERTRNSLLKTAKNISFGVGYMKAISSVLGAIPKINAGVLATAIGGGSADVTIVDGTSLAVASDYLTDVVSLVAQDMDRQASISSNTAADLRRETEWKHQLELAEKEVENLNKQILGAEIRRDIAIKEKENLEQQIENSEITLEFLQTKYTNEELYNWHAKNIAKIHQKMYNLAYDVAKRAERLYEFELEIEPKFIKGDNWDGDRKGLLAGERLALQLQQMDVSYLDNNKREQEITKTISLAELDSEQLFELKENGSCEIEIPEWNLDLDFPGQYLRRVRGVNITIPCVKGAYSDINATLTLKDNRIRKKGIYSDDLPINIQNNGQVSLASAQSDSGVFEFSFKDERFLPFEGAGAISTWILSLPGANDNIPKAFDYNLISDVIMKLNYSARLGGSGSEKRITTGLAGTFVKKFSMKEKMPYTLAEILDSVDESNVNVTVDFELDKELVPYYLADETSSSDKELVIFNDTNSENTPVISFVPVAIDEATGTFSLNDENGDVVTELEFDSTYKLECTNVAELTDIIITMNYKIQATSTNS